MGIQVENYMNMYYIIIHRECLIFKWLCIGNADEMFEQFKNYISSKNKNIQIN